MTKQWLQENPTSRFRHDAQLAAHIEKGAQAASCVDTSVRGMVLPPQIAANAGLNVFLRCDHIMTLSSSPGHPISISNLEWSVISCIEADRCDHILVRMKDPLARWKDLDEIDLRPCVHGSTNSIKFHPIPSNSILFSWPHFPKCESRSSSTC